MSDMLCFLDGSPASFWSDAWLMALPDDVVLNES